MITAGDALAMSIGFAVMAATIYVFGGEGERSLGRFFEGLAVVMLLVCIMELQ